MQKKPRYEVKFISEFDKNIKRFIRKKKFYTLPEQIEELEKLLEKGEFPGTRITQNDKPKPHEVYKLRLPNPDTKLRKIRWLSPFLHSDNPTSYYCVAYHIL